MEENDDDQWAALTAEALSQWFSENEKMSIDLFLQEVYRLAETGDIPGATDLIFDYIDRLLCEGSFEVCNDILNRVDLDKLPSSLRRSFLTITAAAESKIPARSDFKDKVYGSH